MHFVDTMGGCVSKRVSEDEPWVVVSAVVQASYNAKPLVCGNTILIILFPLSFSSCHPQVEPYDNELMQCKSNLV